MVDETGTSPALETCARYKVSSERAEDVLGLHENANNEVLRATYAEVCRSYERIDDFRAKLLGILPLVSGTGLFLLAGKNEVDTDKAHNEIFVLLGTFGFVVTLGLLFHELRGIQRCIRLATVGAALEYQMGVEGRFRRWPHSVGRFINEPIAAAFIYSGVLASWIFLTVFQASLLAALAASGAIFLVAFLAVWRFYWYTTKKEKAEKGRGRSSP